MGRRAGPRGVPGPSGSGVSPGGGVLPRASTVHDGDMPWQELADHSIGHDQLSTAVPHPDAYRRYAAQRLAELAAARREQP